jgi:hypothetical protein
LEEQYDYPSSYYSGMQMTPFPTDSCENCVVYKCVPPHVDDDQLSDAYDKYVLPPPGGVVALAKIYGFDRFGVKLLHTNKTVVDAVACAFSSSIEGSCENTYGAFSEASWDSFSTLYVTTIRRWVSAGLSPVIGIPVFDTWSADGYPEILPFPVPDTAKPIGYHALAICNFSLTTDDCASSLNTAHYNVYGAAHSDAGCLKLRNSWGEDVGNAGYHWMPTAYLTTYLWGGRVDLNPVIGTAWPFPFRTAAAADFSRDWQSLLAGGVVITPPPV